MYYKKHIFFKGDREVVEVEKYNPGRIDLILVTRYSQLFM